MVHHSHLDGEAGKNEVMLRKRFKLLVAILIITSLIVITLIFLWQQRHAENGTVSEITSLEDRQLPEVPLIEFKSDENYFDKVISGDVLLVFSVTGCDACTREMQILAENRAEIRPGMRVYGVMFEDRRMIEHYIQVNNINFPILLDDGGRLREKLLLRYFPTNFKLIDGTIKEAWFGVERDKDKFISRINLRTR